MAHRVVVHHAGEHQQDQGAIERREGVAWLVEKEDVAKPKHHAGHRQRQHGQQVEQLAQRGEVAPLLLGPGEQHDKAGAGQRREGAELEGVGKREPAIDAVGIEAVVVEAERQVVGPELHQRAVDRHAEQGEKGQRPQRAPEQRQGVADPVRRRLVGDGAGTHLLLHAPAHPVLKQEAQQGRQQQ